MNEDNKILVFGATGQQGGATARKLLKDGWKVSAFTRNEGTEAAKILKALGAEIVTGDMDDFESLQKAMRGVFGVFSVQPPNWQPSTDTDRIEAKRGKLIANVAKESGVKHLVYSSVLASQQMETFRPGFKYSIEKHVWKIGVPATVLRPAGFMENLLLPQLGISQGSLYDPTLPEIRVNYIAIEDIAAFAAMAFRRPEEFIGKTMDLSGDSLTLPELAHTISESIGRPVQYVQIPMDAVYEQSRILGDLIAYLNKNGYPEIDFTGLRRLKPDLLTVAAWLKNGGSDAIINRTKHS